ncbi:MAG: RsmE family RNA methyltransferase, partial [Myxococcales bacterium]|nr:RsmE family RNA methyltransferase [Myxococcales bacterium]
MTRRFFVPALAPVGETLALPEGVLHHLEVLRLGDGARFVLFDGGGEEARVVREGGRARVESRASAEATGRRVVLVLGMPKGTKLDEIVRMTTELGVYAIHLAHTAHAVARPDEARAQKKVERW